MSATILIVDDDVAIARGLTLRLGSAGYNTISVIDGGNAIREAREKHPDSIIVDNRLPDMDGLDVITQLQADPSTKDIPIIMLSGAEANRSAALTAGARDFLGKPYDSKSLMLVLRNLLQDADHE